MLRPWKPLVLTSFSLASNLTLLALEPVCQKLSSAETASAFRYEDDVPVLVPGVNDDHARLIEQQRQQRGWKGFISPNPNCTTVGLAISLAPLVRAFGVDTVVMTSLQAVSGAGRNGGVLSLDIIDNVIPYIPKEEDKVRREVSKILGQVTAAGLEPLPMRISATCTRVPVMDGHTASVLAVTSRQASVSAAREAMESFGREFVELGLPSSPRQFIVVHDDPYRPQPRLDRDTDDGMATVVGRLRADTAFDNGLQYVVLSHNTKMGAAKARCWRLRCWCTRVILAERRGARAALAPRLQPALGVDGRHTATAGSGDGLAIHVVSDVASGKHTRNTRLGRTGCGDDIALGVQGELSTEERRVGNMTDSHEQAIGLDLTDLISFDVTYLDSLARHHLGQAPQARLRSPCPT